MSVGATSFFPFVGCNLFPLAFFSVWHLLLRLCNLVLHGL